MVLTAVRHHPVMVERVVELLRPHPGGVYLDATLGLGGHAERLLQTVPDIFLGWATGPDGNDYYVRQLRDMKATIPIERFAADGLADYAALCAGVLARAHACSGDAAQIAANIEQHLRGVAAELGATPVLRAGP
jgi:hypothetical protein